MNEKDADGISPAERFERVLFPLQKRALPPFKGNSRPLVLFHYRTSGEFSSEAPTKIASSLAEWLARFSH
jgi:hypothetical protein